MSEVLRHDPRRAMYARQYGLTRSQVKNRFVDRTFLDQLDACKDDESRRILLSGLVKKRQRRSFPKAIEANHD